MSQNHHPQLYYLKALSTFDSPQIHKMDTSHIMILFFFIDGLHILNQQSLLATNQLQQKLVDYILALQFKNGSFTSSSLYQNLSHSSSTENKYETGHIVFTYSAVNSLKILGALDRVKKNIILTSIKNCMKSDGSFSCFSHSTQCDLRFVYSALSICKIFDDFSIIDKAKTLQYINSCFNYDGGFGLRPQIESHAGAIFCAIASYEHLNEKIPEKTKKRVLNFLVNRQSTQVENENIVGVQGRVGKLPDSCYSFWVGASIMMLTENRNLLSQNIKNFIEMCFKPQEQSFAKYPSNKRGDSVHTFHSVMGLKILKGETDDISLSQLLRK